MTYFNSDPKPPKKEKKKPVPLKRTAIRKQFKASGEGALFDDILNTRKHLSFVSGLPIDIIDNVTDHSNCHHVLFPKDTYKRFRCYKKNIILVTKYEHWLIHSGGIERRKKYVQEISIMYGKKVDWEKLDNLRADLYFLHETNPKLDYSKYE